MASDLRDACAAILHCRPGTQCRELQELRSKATNDSQLPVEPPDGLRNGVIINPEVLGDHPEPAPSNPHPGRVSRDALVHWDRRRPDEMRLNRQSGQSANVFPAGSKLPKMPRNLLYLRGLPPHPKVPYTSETVSKPTGQRTTSARPAETEDNGGAHARDKRSRPVADRYRLQAEPKRDRITEPVRRPAEDSNQATRNRVAADAAEVRTQNPQAPTHESQPKSPRATKGKQSRWVERMPQKTPPSYDANSPLWWGIDPRRPPESREAERTNKASRNSRPTQTDHSVRISQPGRNERTKRSRPSCDQRRARSPHNSTTNP